MSGVSSIAYMYAAKTVPSPCKDCSRRKAACRSSCEAWGEYSDAVREARRRVEANYKRIYSAQDYLNANAAMRVKHYKKRGGE